VPLARKCQLIGSRQVFEKAEIPQLRRVITVQKDVGRLDVAVQDVIAVQITQPVSDLQKQRYGLIHGQRSATLESTFQVGAGDVFHDDERRARILMNALNSHQPRMAQAANHREFALKAFHGAGLHGHELAARFDGDRFAGFLVAGLVNRGGGAVTEFLDHLVRPEDGGRSAGSSSIHGCSESNSIDGPAYSWDALNRHRNTLMLGWHGLTVATLTDAQA
jgi:hypothetical protein